MFVWVCFKTDLCSLQVAKRKAAIKTSQSISQDSLHRGGGKRLRSETEIVNHGTTIVHQADHQPEGQSVVSTETLSASQTDMDCLTDTAGDSFWTVSLEDQALTNWPFQYTSDSPLGEDDYGLPCSGLSLC